MRNHREEQHKVPVGRRGTIKIPRVVTSPPARRETRDAAYIFMCLSQGDRYPIVPIGCPSVRTVSRESPVKAPTRLSKAEGGAIVQASAKN